MDFFKRSRVINLTQGELKAMEELAKLEVKRGNPAYMPEAGTGKAAIPVKKERMASNKMCTFLILNISSLQLISVNMIVYRQQYGSVNPTAVIAPTLVAMLYCKVKVEKRRG